jgi:hypothetical protein
VLSRKTPAAELRAAVENKTIMAAHGKARWNRYGDIIAYSNHIHNHNRECIAAAIVVINCSPAYANPDAFAKDLVRPRFNMPRVVAATVKIFADIPLRTNPEERNERDAGLIQMAFEELEVGGVIAGDVPSFRVDQMPYGGVKDSGLCREGLRYSIEDMTERRLLVMAVR